MSLPSSFGASSESALGSIVLERIGRIFPETGAEAAIQYLRGASLALSLSRSYQGITASSSKELVPFFDSILQGGVTEETVGYLERAVRLERESPLDRTNSRTRANRVKAAFHLVSAATLSLPP